MGWFEEWFGTRYYALLYGHRDERDAGAWVEMIMRQWRLRPGSRILDMACGRGRHAGCFQAAGMQVEGIDLSAQSIAEARERYPEVPFHVHDMRQPFAEGRFDGVTCLFTSLGYFDNLSDDSAVLRSAYHALVPGGRLVIDFMNTPKVLSELVAQETMEKEGVRFEIARRSENGIIIKSIVVFDGDRIERFEERVLALLPEVIEGLAVQEGFEVEARTDGPDPAPYDPLRSGRYVLWLKRPLE
jgi:SAM-dependent methyltransferase